MSFRKYIIILLAVCFQISVYGHTIPENQRPEEDILTSVIPEPKGRISDFENLFTTTEVAQLDSIILDFEKLTANQIAIVTLNEFQFDKKNFDDYTLLLANTWGIGQKENNNGILIAISTKIRQMRIQNGIGIEKILSDKETKQIIDKYFLPQFKEGNYFEGTKNGLLELIKILGERLDDHKKAEQLADYLIELIEQKDIETLQEITTETMYCYLCFDKTPKQEPFITKRSFYKKHFKSVFDNELIQRLKRNEKEIFITDKDSPIWVRYTTYQNNESGIGHEGVQFVFWLKEENGILKLNGIEVIP